MLLTFKRSSLTVFFIALSLSIGLPSFNLQSSPNQAFASENKITEAIKKACPSYEDIGNLKEKASNIVKACLSNLPPNPIPPILGPSKTINLSITMDARGSSSS